MHWHQFITECFIFFVCALLGDGVYCAAALRVIFWNGSTNEFQNNAGCLAAMLLIPITLMCGCFGVYWWRITE